MEVTVKKGKLRGCMEKNVYGGNYYAFKGVPYAKPPIGPLRFEDPVEPDPWSDVKDATKFGDKCAQVVMGEIVSGSEDCLHLNVYTPCIKPDKKLPVMVSFHWGIFLMGSSNSELYGADYLVRKEVVLVTVNSRLGILGFLNLNDPVAPGNQGLRDCLMALNWVKDNVSSFGGDPDNITLFGTCAGSCILFLLVKSGLAEGLYHKIICQSGIPTCPWVFTAERHRDAPYKIASALGCDSKDPKTIVEFFRTVDYHTLVKHQEKLYDDLGKVRGIVPFGPTVDDKSSNPIVPRPPEEMQYAPLKVPLLIGHSTEEGLHLCKESDYETMKKMNLQYADCLPIMHEKLERNGLNVHDATRLYDCDEPVNRESLKKYLYLVTDMAFVEDMYHYVQIQLEKSSQPIYMYEFSYDTGDSLIKKLFNITLPGCTHGEDLSYLFYNNVMKIYGKNAPEPGTVKYRIIQYFTEMWTNFARTGNPTPTKSRYVAVQWTPVQRDSEECHYLRIASELQMRTKPKSSLTYKWLKLVKKKD
ncbi:esterase B1-like [Prorops nasuta]|uniref:esterase B1-like n=1 Tax=Prorops nasuta TaxID=863751 RepID=UPI0034CD9290